MSFPSGEVQRGEKSGLRDIENGFVIPKLGKHENKLCCVSQDIYFHLFLDFRVWNRKFKTLLEFPSQERALICWTSQWHAEKMFRNGILKQKRRKDQILISIHARGHILARLP